MAFFDCDEFCRGSRRSTSRRIPVATTMQPVVYADPLSAPLPTQYVSYPVAATTYSSGAEKAAPTTATYTKKHVELPSGYSGISGSHMTPAPLSAMPSSGQYFSNSAPAHEIIYYPTSSGGPSSKAVESEFMKPLSVPEAGTQSRNKFRADDRPQRVSTAPALAPRDATSVSFQQEWNQEIKALQKMLDSRERQLEDKEQELRDALAELHDLRKQASASTQATDKRSDSSSSQHQDAELQAMRKRLDLLRHERQELMELLLQKEKQVAVMDSIDPTDKEASALQLGVQAITMVQTASELREKLDLAEAEIKKLKAEKTEAAELQQDTFEKLTDKRREAAELLELLSQRDMKVARVEAYLQQKTRELDIFAARSKERLQKEQRKREEAEQELLVAREQCNSFKASLASRDEKLLQVQAEVVRRDTLLKQLEDRVRVLSDDLTAAHSQLQQLLKGMAAKDAYMQELEAQLRKNDSERQVAYLTEVSKSRKLVLDTRIQQEQCRAALNDRQEKLAAAKHDLIRSRTVMERIRKAISSATEEVETVYSPSEAIQSSGSHSHTRVPLQLPPNPASDIPSVPVKQSLQALGADFIAREEPAEVKSRPVGQSAPKSQAPSPQATSSSAPLSFSAGYGQAEELYQPYVAVSGDPLDQAVAQVFQKPEYKHLASRICRLGPGAYLCSMEEVCMALERGEKVVINWPGGPRVPLTSYLDQLRSGEERCKKTQESAASASSKVARH